MEFIRQRVCERWGVLLGRWPHRFAPALAPLRCARPVWLQCCRAPNGWGKIRGMKDFELYQQILGLAEPWRVESVTLKAKERVIEVRVCFSETLWGCPQCQERMQIHDYEERRWRHLDSCQFQTIIVSRVPVVRCDTHGSQTVAVPWGRRSIRALAGSSSVWPLM